MIRFYSSEEKRLTAVSITLPYTGTAYTSADLYLNDDHYTATWSQNVYGGIYAASGWLIINRDAQGGEISPQRIPAQNMGVIMAQAGMNTVYSPQGEVTIADVDLMPNAESFIFDGLSTSFFGIGLSGTGVWDAPARKGESVSVPGRNGNIWVDDGCFENIFVTYPCWMSKDFSANIDDFRAFLSAHSDNYYMLRDTYHPGEFRMARYAGAFAADPGTRNESGRFDVTFDCMPQRYLATGNEWQPMTIGGRTYGTNPTLFPASPVICYQFDGVSPGTDRLILAFNDVQTVTTTTITIPAGGGSVYYLDTADYSVRRSIHYEVDSPDWNSFPTIGAKATLSGDGGDLILKPGKTINIYDQSTGTETPPLLHLSMLPRWWTI